MGSPVASKPGAPEAANVRFPLWRRVLFQVVKAIVYVIAIPVFLCAEVALIAAMYWWGWKWITPLAYTTALAIFVGTFPLSLLFALFIPAIVFVVVAYAVMFMLSVPFFVVISPAIEIVEWANKWLLVPSPDRREARSRIEDS